MCNEFEAEFGDRPVAPRCDPIGEMYGPTPCFEKIHSVFSVRTKKHTSERKNMLDTVELKLCNSAQHASRCTKDENCLQVDALLIFCPLKRAKHVERARELIGPIEI